MISVSSLIFTATDTAFFQTSKSPDLQNLEFFCKALLRILLISRSPVLPQTLRRSMFGYSFSIYNSNPDRARLEGFWGSIVFRHAPSQERGRIAARKTNL